MSQPQSDRWTVGSTVGAVGALASLGSLVVLLVVVFDPLLVAGATLGLLLCLAALVIPRSRSAPRRAAAAGGTSDPLGMHFYTPGAMPRLSTRLAVTHDLVVVGTGFTQALFETPARLEKFLERPDTSMRVLLPLGAPDDGPNRRAAELRTEQRTRALLDQVAELRRPDVEVRALPGLALSALVLDRSDVWLHVDVDGGRQLYAVSDFRAGRRAAVLVDEIEAQWRVGHRVDLAARGTTA